jgi:phenylpyruvate tautomerase PptA (4-oxalocrotonate tautomerase family)
MPMMDLTLPEGTLSHDQRTALVDELTTVLLRAERAPDAQLFRDITWVFVHELPAGDVYAAGRPVEQPIVRLEVTTPEGALSDRRRAELVENATRAIREAAGMAEADTLQRVWVVCREVPEGSWGAGGQVVQFKMLADAAAAAREGAEPTLA